MSKKNKNQICDCGLCDEESFFESWFFIGPLAFVGLCSLAVLWWLALHQVVVDLIGVIK